VRERALTTSKHLRKHIKEQLPKDKDPVRSTIIPECMYSFVRTFQENTTGVLLPLYSAFAFLDRMVKTSHLRPLKRLGDGPDHQLSELKQRYKQKALDEIKSKEPQTFAQRTAGLFKSFFSRASISVRDPDDIAAQILEEDRVIANVLGLAVVISVNFSKGDGQFNEPLL
jgi:hypothetical protein